MSENIVSDDLFAQYVKEQEQEAKLASSNKGSFQRTYEDIKYTGLESGIPSVIRAVDGPPDSKISPYTAKTVTIARVVDDNGKQMKLIRPSISEDPTYLINKIISKVKEVKWVQGADGKNVKTYPVKDTYPAIFNIIEKNGLGEGDKRAKFDKGWNGKEVLIMNVIDRAQMDWHRENKHTMLLAKSISEYNGVEFVDEGVSSYAILPRFQHLFKAYGSWEKYDIAITRTGSMNNPFVVVNASNSPKEVEGPNARYITINNEGLTDEEKSWERYDLEKLFRVTTYTKIYNRLKNTIKRIDGVLGTTYLQELENLVTEEKAKFAEMYDGENSSSTPAESTNSNVMIQQSTPNSTQATVEGSRPVPRSRVVENAAPGFDLPYYNTLSEDLKKAIISAKHKETEEGWDITWNTKETVYGCPSCGTPAPESASCCPACGESF